MKLSNQQLKQIIKEELMSILKESQTALGLDHKFKTQEAIDKFEDLIKLEDKQQLAKWIPLITNLIRDTGISWNARYNKKQQQKLKDLFCKYEKEILGRTKGGVCWSKGWKKRREDYATAQRMLIRIRKEQQ